MQDVITQVPWRTDTGWAQATYWGGDEFTVDRYTDGDHDDIEEADVPTADAVKQAWREYYQDVASTGADPLGVFASEAWSTIKRVERWQFKFNNSIIGPVLVAARRAGRDYHGRDLPTHVQFWLTLAPNGLRITSMRTWAELEAAQPSVRRNVWFTVRLDGMARREERLVKRDVQRAARRALRTKGWVRC